MPLPPQCPQHVFVRLAALAERHAPAECVAAVFDARPDWRTPAGKAVDVFSVGTERRRDNFLLRPRPRTRWAGDLAVRALVNRAPRGASAFAVDPLDFLNEATAQAARGRHLRAWYHSHPHGPGRPSAADLLAAWAGCEIWIGAGTRAFVLRAFTARGEELWRLDPREGIAPDPAPGPI